MSLHPLVPNHNRKANHLTTCSDLDMIGILSRDFDILQSVSDSLFNISHDSPPSAKPTLIYPSHLFPAGDRAAEAIYEKVVSSLEKLLQLERRVVNFTEEWSRAQAFTIESFKDYFAPVSCLL